jgi:hypothetical protein
MPRLSLLAAVLLLSACRTDPSGPSVTISPASPTTVDDLIATVDCKDCKIRWFKDNVPQDIEGTMVTKDLTTKGETWSILVTEVADDGTEGLPGEAEAMILNSLPELGELSISPSEEVYTNDILTATIDASDADHEAFILSYAWSVDGSVVGSTTDSLDGLVHFDKGQEVILTVTATDGEGESQVSSDPIVVLNSPPSAPEVALQQNGDLICEISTESDDLDDESITYTFVWTVDGDPFTSATTTEHVGDTVHEDVLQDEELWTCIVTPDDGEATGDTAQDSYAVDWSVFSNDGLIAQYAFDEASGDVLEDLSGTGNHGQLGNTSGSDQTDPLWRTGYLSFDGSCATIPVDPTQLGSWSMQLVYRAPEQSGQIRLGGVKADNRTRWQMTPEGDELRFSFATGDNDGNTVQTHLYASGAQNNDWRVLTYTQADNNQVTLYLDGAVADSETLHTTPNFTNLNAFTLAAAQCDSQAHDAMEVDMAYALFYDRDLSGAEVLKHQDFFDEMLSTRNLKAEPSDAGIYTNCTIVDEGLRIFEVCGKNGIGWDDADSACRSNGYDGLASLHSSDEQASVEQIAGPHLWIGLNDKSTETTFEWADGSTFDESFAPWGPDQPDDTDGTGPSADCVVLNPNSTWQDATCGASNMNGFICSWTSE